MKKAKEQIMHIIFLISAAASVISVAFICLFLFANGIPAIGKAGLFKFLTGRYWAPLDTPPSFGILPMISGSIYITGGAIITGVPIGILTAVFMVFYCPKKLYRSASSAIQLLAGIPSVVYGFFGLMIIVPLVRALFGGHGSSMLTASVLLGIMILPTVISVSEAALKNVPKSYYEGALALGATHEKSIFSIMLPAAKSGILAATTLSIGRAAGETMAVVMVAGNQPRMPKGLLKGVRTLTSNIVIEMGYSTGLHREMLIATGVVLFAFILIINLCVAVIKK